MSTGPWTIVLAGGAGRRLASVTGGVPKQYFRPDGRGSLLESTFDRLGTLATPERTRTVVDSTHRQYVRSLKGKTQLGDVVYQPRNRGTAAGVLLPLLSVLEAANDPVVLITPSDHAVEDTDCFRTGLEQAIARVHAGQSEIVLFGVEPATPTGDFGWITPDVPRHLGRSRFGKVAAFVEKPPIDEAARLLASGAVWNTMVVVARATALYALYRRHLPLLAEVFTAALEMHDEARQQFLQDRYQDLPATDFCRDLLTPASDLCLYTWPVELRWSDLGTPDRLADWLEARAFAASFDVPSCDGPARVACRDLSVARQDGLNERGAA